MAKKNDLQAAIEAASQRFAADILAALRGATLDEIMDVTADASSTARKAVKTAKAAPAAVAPVPAPKKRGRPPKKVEETAVAPVPEPEKKERKKRAWPKCSIDGCGKNVYMPSGARKMCYQHHIEAGGKPSPLVTKTNAERKAAARSRKASASPAEKS